MCIGVTQISIVGAITAGVQFLVTILDYWCGSSGH